MSRKVNGVVVATTTAEQKVLVGKALGAAIKRLRAKQSLNKHQMYVVGATIRALSDAKFREFMADLTGTWNRAIWKQMTRSGNLGGCLKWAIQVNEAFVRIGKKQGPTGTTSQRAAYTWALQQVNRI